MRTFLQCECPVYSIMPVRIEGQQAIAAGRIFNYMKENFCKGSPRSRALAPILLVVSALSWAGSGVPPATACAIDGKPSVFANATQAKITVGAPTIATRDTWAHFSFPHRYAHGLSIDFHEAMSLLPRSWLSRVNHSRWQWAFGDGTRATALQVRHMFHRSGTYKVTVNALYPHLGWQTFDSVEITVS